MFQVYAHVSDLKSRDLCTRLHTQTHTHFPDKKQAFHQKKGSFNNDYSKYSHHLATTPFNWKFSFDKSSKYDEKC